MRDASALRIGDTDMGALRVENMPHRANPAVRIDSPRRAHWDSPGSRTRCVRACSGSLTARESVASRSFSTPQMWPSAFSYGVGVPEGVTFAADTRLHVPRGQRRMTRGPVWLAWPSPYDSFIRSTSPV